MSDIERPDGLGENDPVAHDRAYTDWTKVGFSLKEGGRGEPRIMIEEDGPGLPVLKYGDAFLMLHCRPGVTYEQAQPLVRQLETLIDSISYTKFIT